MLKPIAVVAVLLAGLGTAKADTFTLNFNWGNTPDCRTGHPVARPNPTLVLNNVPPGTHILEFQMVDLNVPRFNHGGGAIKYRGQNVISPGAFSYFAPCPPDGQQHRYAWTVIAKDTPGVFANVLGKASAIKPFPER